MQLRAILRSSSARRLVWLPRIFGVSGSVQSELSVRADHEPPCMSFSCGSSPVDSGSRTAPQEPRAWQQSSQSGSSKANASGWPHWLQTSSGSGRNGLLMIRRRYRARKAGRLNIYRHPISVHAGGISASRCNSFRRTRPMNCSAFPDDLVQSILEPASPSRHPPMAGGNIRSIRTYARRSRLAERRSHMKEHGYGIRNTILRVPPRLHCCRSQSAGESGPESVPVRTFGAIQ